ncbi:putative protein phosphatase 2C 6 [Artemisia annua]|uniref:PPM-type phosphatase domain-containing protein n=1 Tax=Artemisia annua TaxID=35608 RepID=A0A2U1KU78_ARTAN|nr:putative protein phosphatase 2C 6 [Artemisia annua]
MHEVIAEEWDQEMRRPTPEIVGSTAIVGCLIGLPNHRIPLCMTHELCRAAGTETIPLTVDQKPDREDELLRIEKQDGKVIYCNGARVLGVLAMSRAIGISCRYLRPWIIPVPEITFTTRTDEDECLILASDELWDIMTNNEVGEVARRILRRKRRSAATNDEPSAAQTLADSLTEIAMGDKVLTTYLWSLLI